MLLNVKQCENLIPDETTIEMYEIGLSLQRSER